MRQEFKKKLKLQRKMMDYIYRVTDKEWFTMILYLKHIKWHQFRDTKTPHFVMIN